MIAVEVSQTEHFGMVNLCLRDGLEIADNLVIIMGVEKDCMVTDEVFYKQFFKAVDLCSGDGLEMACCLAMTLWGERLHSHCVVCCH